jgi:hypothetical protein
MSAKSFLSSFLSSISGRKVMSETINPALSADTVIKIIPGYNGRGGHETAVFLGIERPPGLIVLRFQTDAGIFRAKFQDPCEYQDPLIRILQKMVGEDHPLGDSPDVAPLVGRTYVISIGWNAIQGKYLVDVMKPLALP